MFRIKSTLYTSFDLLIQLRKSPRAYIGLFAGIAFTLIPTIQYLNFSKATSEPINVFEIFIIIGSSKVYIAALFMCLLFILSNAPFITERTPYVIVRSTRSDWTYGCVLYIIIVSFLFYSIIFLITFLASLKYGLAINAWSQPMYVLSRFQSHRLFSIYGLYFPFSDIGRTFCPTTAVIYTFLLLNCYGICMSLIMYTLNMCIHKYAGSISVIALHLLGYVLLSDGLPGVVSYMPLTNALLGRNGLGDILLASSFGFSLRVFAVIFITMIVIIAGFTKLTDFRMCSDKRQL